MRRRISSRCPDRGLASLLLHPLFFRELYAPQTKISEGRTNFSECVFEALFNVSWPKCGTHTLDTCVGRGTCSCLADVVDLPQRPDRLSVYERKNRAKLRRIAGYSHSDSQQRINRDHPCNIVTKKTSDDHQCISHASRIL